MKPKSFLLLMFVPLLWATPGLAQSKKQNRVKRQLLGEQLDYGREAARFGLWNEAIFHWEKVVEADPNNAQATNNLAVAYESVGNFEKAEALYKQALDLDEDSTDIRKNLKRFRSFYRKHKRQLMREKKIKAKRKAESEDEKAKQKEIDDEGGLL